ncbi:MAG: hypothetical protein R6U20_08055 [Longimonas sp.]|uniref:hypothetical protein n=1 Tax=Longimonas sp. TaxID=2039626 RepID=UPI003976E406
MKTETILEELVDVAERMDIAVRIEKGDFQGGRCHMGGETVIMLNKRHPIEVQLAVLGRSLRTEPLDTVYLKPAVRDALHAIWDDADAADDPPPSSPNASESPRAHAS